MNNFNSLTPAETERLAILMEEMAEAQHIIGKILRHGYESRDPTKAKYSRTNRELLEQELGHVRYAMLKMCIVDLSKSAIHKSADNKALNISKYLHHQ